MSPTRRERAALIFYAFSAGVSAAGIVHNGSPRWWLVVAAALLLFAWSESKPRIRCRYCRTTGRVTEITCPRCQLSSKP